MNSLDLLFGVVNEGEFLNSVNGQQVQGKLKITKLRLPSLSTRPDPDNGTRDAPFIIDSLAL